MSSPSSALPFGVMVAGLATSFGGLFLVDRASRSQRRVLAQLGGWLVIVLGVALVLWGGTL